MNDLIQINSNGQAVASSRDIAEHFEKRPDNVLRDIEGLKKDLLNFEEMFFETEIPDSYGRPQRAYLMNRDGFTLLAMGFTGKTALEWKVKYIEAFNAMEKTITGGKLPNAHTDPAVAAERARVMGLNAKCRVAGQMLKLWQAAGVEPQYQALAMQGYYPGLSLPREALKENAVALLDATTIASHLGITSNRGKPHAMAVTAIIRKIGKLSADEYTMTPYCKNGHDGVSIQYTDSVEVKVAHWLEDNHYPATISDGGKNLSVKYSLSARGA